MKACKGFNKDMTCRGFQFEEGKTYEEEEAKLCEKGFHACLNPLDCWTYYDCLNSVFHEVELEDVSDERIKEDSKICAKKITIGGKLDIKGIVSASVEFVMDSVKDAMNLSKKNNNSGDDAKIGSSGDDAKIGSSGDDAKIECSSDHAVVVCAGKRAKVNGLI